MFSWVRLSHIADWCKARQQHSMTEWAQIAVPAISSDTRALRAGDVFLALKGENFDGHAFMEAAVAKGAVAIISERDAKLSVPLLRVENTLQAFIDIARSLRKSFTGPVIAITGSAGKSSTKEMVATLIGSGALASPASFNNLLGLSKTLSLIEDSTQYLVLEMGMNALGEISELCRNFVPEAGLITNIGDAHLGKLGGRDGIYTAKKELWDYLAKMGSRCRGVALNIDDDLVRQAYRTAFSEDVRTVTYSAEGREADVRISGSRIDPKTGHLVVNLVLDGETGIYSFPLYGFHHQQNIAAAVAAAVLLDIPSAFIHSRLAKIAPSTHRGELFTLSEGKVLIDESYNSNPTALKASLRSLSAFPAERRRVLILGEMKELEEFSAAKHKEVGDFLVELYRKRSFPLYLIGVGRECETLIKSVKTALPEARCLHLESREMVMPHLRSELKPNDLILIKGSRGVKLDEVVRDLKSQFLDQ